MKIPFDIVKTIVINHQYIDFTTSFSWFTQSLLDLALFQYYGLFGRWIKMK